MKSIREILANYSEYKTPLQDRFGHRFADFLTEKQIGDIGFALAAGHKHEPVKWTRENVLKQLKRDIEFGIEKAEEERGISSSLMFEVVLSWVKVLDDYADLMHPVYKNYGLGYFYEVRDKYFGTEEKQAE